MCDEVASIVEQRPRHSGSYSSFMPRHACNYPSHSPLVPRFHQTQPCLKLAPRSVNPALNGKSKVIEMMPLHLSTHLLPLPFYCDGKQLVCAFQTRHSLRGVIEKFLQLPTSKDMASDVEWGACAAGRRRQRTVITILIKEY